MPSNYLNCNCLALRQATRLATQLYDQHLALAGLRCTQVTILAQLKRLGPTTINTLAAEMVVDRTTLGRNIQPLERDGLIRIERSAVDGRSKELQLTRKGNARLGLALERWAEAQEHFETAYGAKRSAELRSMLEGVVACTLGTSPLGDR